MTKCIAAFTPSDMVYPPFFNASLDGDEVVITVRGEPSVSEGVYICGYRADAGKPGRCTPGDDRCNNYCNLADDKGPMADAPSACTHTKCGETVAMRMPVGVFRGLLSEMVKGVVTGIAASDAFQNPAPHSDMQVG